MSEPPSTMLEVGTEAPSFSLPEPASGNQVNLSDYSGKPLLVVFSCNHCPYVLHIINSFTEFANTAQHRGLGVVMISSNDVAGYPADSPEKMVELAVEQDDTAMEAYLDGTEPDTENLSRCIRSGAVSG